MKQHNKNLLASEQAKDILQQLRERIGVLEGENASFHQLDETLARNTRMVQAVLRKSHEGFLLVTPQMTVLKTIHSVLGYHEEDLTGQSALTKIHPEDHVQVKEAFSCLLNNPSEAIRVECRVSNQGGDWRWMEVEMTDMLDDPDVQAIIWNNRDITERKRNQSGFES